MADSRWSAYGAFVWLRFRALGVPDAFTAVDRWMRQTDVDAASDILLESTLFALAADGASDDRALTAFHCNARQLRCILSAPPEHRLVLLLREFDGLEPDRAGEMAGVSASVCRAAMDGVRNELDALADPEPEGTQPDSHLSSMDFLGYANETLGPMRSGQVEQHLASCSACYQRFEAWSDTVETFAARVPPAPPAPPPDRRPLLAVLAFAALSMLVAVGGLGFVMVASNDRAEQASAFALQTPGVQLVVDGRAGVDVASLAPGTLIQVRYDPKNAHFVGLGLRTADQPRVLMSGAVPDPGRAQLAPLELLHEVGGERALYVLISDRPLLERDVLDVVGGEVVADVAVAVVPL